MNDSYLNFLSMQLFAEVSAMNAENNQRMVLGQSMVYIDKHYYAVIDRYKKLYDEYLKVMRKRG